MFDVKIFIKENAASIFVFIGFIISLILSFYDFSYNKGLVFFPKDKPNMFLLVIAIFLLCCFILKYLPFLSRFINSERRQYSYVIDIDENHKITIKQGNISSYKGDTNKAVLLPANTSFDEKCITDSNSALGSYFLKNYPGKIDETRKKIVDTAANKFSLSIGKKCADPGDTILLPKYDGEKINILISAVTQDIPDIGIQANAVGIINTVKNAISLCSENRYFSITMPMIGTGHGGLSPKVSLMLICIQYFISIYHFNNHHVKELEILVFDQDKRLKKNIDEAVESIKKLISKKSR